MARHSCKSFASTPIPPDVLAQLESYIRSPAAVAGTPFNKGAAFRFVWTTEYLSRGIIFSSKGSIICVKNTTVADQNLVEIDLSYAFERLQVELLTRLGLAVVCGSWSDVESHGELQVGAERDEPPGRPRRRRRHRLCQPVWAATPTAAPASPTHTYLATWSQT
eukprot:TRINITY_DN11725_c0_g1_i1.p2 TRINITY_DN11725_c0_g1~~TRINITY_DN11725_c0_g1_i1.p2  ORF type:complete len:164 (-),score=33.57 TRINITY_DN11725_c0_g1_i1:78-569(-)